MGYVPYVIMSILGLAVLMIVHEGGHYLAARKFGMRVTRFSIGFGPTIWRHQPSGSATVYQVAIIPFLAYVQIAGLNPYEEIDPNDPESYANASLWARIVTIAAGPLTNYLFASVLIFFGLLIGGERVPDMASMRVDPDEAGAAYQAGIQKGDKIVAVNETSIPDWEALKKAISAHPGEEIDVTIERDGKLDHKRVRPAPAGDSNAGKILIGPLSNVVPIGLGKAAKLSVLEPPLIVYATVRDIGRIIMRKLKPDLGGPIRMVGEMAKVAKFGPGEFLQALGALSAYLGAFNLLPVPALDGGRLMFLGAEAVSRRKPDAKLEASVHAIGLLMLLGLILVVTYGDIFRIFHR